MPFLLATIPWRHCDEEPIFGLIEENVWVGVANCLCINSSPLQPIHFPLSVQILAWITRVLFWCFPKLWSNEGNKYQTSHQVVHKQFIMTIYADSLVQDCSNSSALAMELLQSCTKPSIHYSISYMIWWAHMWRSKRQFSHIDIMPHLVCFRSDDDTTDCATLMVASQLTSLGSCDTCTWKMIMNLLDIDFIHGDIHGWTVRMSNTASRTVHFIPMRTSLKHRLRHTLYIHVYNEVNDICYCKWQNACNSLLLCLKIHIQSCMEQFKPKLHTYAIVNLFNFRPGNGLSIVRYQAVTWTYADLQ